MKTEIICIIDKSGSMNKIKNDAIGGFNAFLQEQRKLEDDTRMSVVLFDSSYRMIQESVLLTEANELDEVNYIPGSMTALYDAIGFSIEKTLESIKSRPDSEKPDRVLVIILTDGEENRSHEYTREAIFNMIEEQRKNDWEFIFLGADQDSMTAAGAIGISKGNALNFVSSGKGTREVYGKMSSVTMQYRSSSSATNDSLFSDDKK